MKKIIVLLFATTLILLGCSNSPTSNSTTPQNTSNTTTPDPMTNTSECVNTNNLPFGCNVVMLYEGTYTVGVDLPADEYYILPDGLDRTATYEVKADGETVNEGSAGQEGATFTLEDGQTIKIEQAILIPQSAKEEMDSPTRYENGTFLVGEDVPAGNYMIGNMSETMTSSYIIANDKQGNDVVKSRELAPTESDQLVLENGQYVILEGSSMVNLDNMVFINY